MSAFGGYIALNHGFVRSPNYLILRHLYSVSKFSGLSWSEILRINRRKDFVADAGAVAVDIGRRVRSVVRVLLGKRRQHDFNFKDTVTRDFLDEFNAAASFENHET